MAAKVGSFNVTTGVASSTVAVTDVGFTPTVVLFWWYGRTEAGNADGGADAQPGFGCMAGATQRWAISSIMVDDVSSTETVRGQTPDGCILEVDGSLEGRADFSSFDADGFTIVIDTQFVRDYRISYLALDHEEATTGSFRPSSTGPLSQTGLGFQPGCLIFASAGTANQNESTNNNASLCFGAALGSGSDEWTIGCRARNNVTSGNQKSYGFGDEAICAFSNGAGSTGPHQRISLDSLDADGFTVDVIENTGAGRTVWWLALAGGRYFVGDRVSTDTATTGIGFRPEAVLFGGFGKPESSVDTATADINMSMGAATSSTERTAQAFSIDQSSDPSEVWTAISQEQCLISGDIADNIDGLMDLVSMDADGFTTVMDQPDTSAFFQGFVAFAAPVQIVDVDTANYVWSAPPVATAATVSVSVGSAATIFQAPSPDIATTVTTTVPAAGTIFSSPAVDVATTIDVQAASAGSVFFAPSVGRFIPTPVGSAGTVFTAPSVTVSTTVTAVVQAAGTIYAAPSAAVATTVTRVVGAPGTIFAAPLTTLFATVSTQAASAGAVFSAPALGAAGIIEDVCPPLTVTVKATATSVTTKSTATEVELKCP